MDVGTISSLASQTVATTTPTAAKSSAQSKAAATDAQAAAASASSAYSVNVENTDGNVQNKAIKGLTKEQTEALQEGINNSYMSMLKSMASQVTSSSALVQGTLSANGGSQVNSLYSLMINVLGGSNDTLQSYLDDGISALNFDGVQVKTSQFALPAVGTTLEEAAAAISDGGQWSVNAVSDRIFGLASTIANGDSDKLQQMQTAVEKGFKEAGITWKDATGSSSMPKITQDTHNEITRRFNEAYKQMGVSTATNAAASTNAATNAAKKTAAATL